MKGIILAAGKGQRIMELTNGLPKSFLEINGKRIIDHQLNALKAAGIFEIVMLIGYRADLMIKEYGNRDIIFLCNPFYERTNVLSSLWFAKDYLEEGFYFMHADTYFDPTILQDLTRTQQDVVLCVESKKTVDEEMKVKVKDGLVSQISKLLPCSECYGEFTGLAKIGPKFAPAIRRAVIDRIERQNDLDAFFEQALQDVIDSKQAHIHYMDIGPRISVEIDFPEDYARAQQLVAARRE